MVRRNRIDRVEEGAPVVYVSSGVHPRIIELALVTSSAGRIVFTSVNTRATLNALTWGDASGECSAPLVGSMHVWPDATWLEEATLFFVSRLCSDGLCDPEAAARMLLPHGLWNNPFSVTDWQHLGGRRMGGLRALIDGAGHAPKYDVLFRDGTVASSLDAFLHAERMAG